MAPLPVQNQNWYTNPFGPPPPPQQGPPPLPIELQSAFAQIAAQRAQRQLGSLPVFNTPIPQSTPGGASVRDAQKLLEAAASPFLGLAGLGLEAGSQMAGGIGAVGDYFTGTGYTDPRTLPNIRPAETLPGMPEELKRLVEEATQQKETKLGQPLGQLDFESIVPGTPGAAIPAAPKVSSTFDFKPDLSKANARLDAAKPKPFTPKGDKLGSFLEGAAIAAGQVDPSTPWPTALAQMLSGGTQGMRELRLKQEEAELNNEREMRQYELQRAGIDEQRAYHEADIAFKRTQLEQQAVQQNFENAWKVSMAMQPNISANSDGSMVITSRNPDGSTSIKRLGFDDALRAKLAVAQAGQLSGKAGEYAMRQRMLKTAGPEFVLGEYITDLIGKGQDTMLLPPGSAAYDSYVNAVTAKDQEFAAQGLPDKMVMKNAAEERFQRLMQLIYTNQQVRDHSLYILFGIQPQGRPTPAEQKR